MTEHPEVEEVKALHDKMHALLQEMMTLHIELDSRIKSNALSDGELSDIGFFHREMTLHAHDLKQEAAARQDLVGRLLAVRITGAHLRNPSLPMNAKGRYSSATPDISVKPMLPRSGSKEYEEACLALGFSQLAIDRKLAKIHWPNLAELATALAMEGKKIPGIKTKPEPVTTFRRRNTTDG